MFSIIIPLYNKGKKVKNTIESVLTQSYTDFEIVVVDDGSTDDSVQYVKTFDDHRINYFYKDNGGVSSARNYGIEKAQGEWLIFLDADDEMLQESLRCYSMLNNKYPEAKLLVGKQDNQYESSGAIQGIVFKKPDHCTSHPYFNYWTRLFFPCPGTVCIHRSLIERYGFFDERISFFEDIEFMLRMMNCKIVAFSSQKVLKYNQEETGLSGKRHPIKKEMAFYISELLKGNNDFWYKVLLYENLEWMCYWKQDCIEDYEYYRNMQEQMFTWYYKPLHWVRQQMIRHGWI